MASDSRKLLCIEDDSETAAMIAEELVDRGFEVSVAYDGRDGFMAILKDTPDLVLCDINMPIMSGFDVLERLRALAPGLGHIPFVFLTAQADRETELKGRQLGADDYISKPIDFDILVEIIKVRLPAVARTEGRSTVVELNDREVEALTWAARGRTSVQIADILDVAKRTVDFHLDNAKSKLGAVTRTEAAIKAAVGGLIKP